VTTTDFQYISFQHFSVSAFLPMWSVVSSRGQKSKVQGPKSRVKVSGLKSRSEVSGLKLGVEEKAKSGTEARDYGLRTAHHSSSTVRGHCACLAG